MDDFTLDELTVDNHVLNDRTYMEDLESPELTTHNYINLTHICTNAEDRHSREHIQKQITLEFDICRLWCHKPVDVLREYCDAIKVYVFWPLLFKRQNGLPFVHFHPCVQPNISRAWELSLEGLQYIELMEEIVELTKKVVNSSFFIGSLLRIGYKIEHKMLVTEEALNWVKFVGDITLLPKLGSLEKCWPMLSIFFTEYKYHITKFITEDYNLLEEFQTADCEACSEQGEIMKVKGNEEFHNKRFDLAIIYYTRAIEYRPENHILYGNRALCFLRTGQFRNALGDGKRATILRSTWPKGHYYFCDALSFLGEYEWALKANIRAQEVCRHDPAGLKELIQQYIKFQRQIENLQGQPEDRGQLGIADNSSRKCSALSVPSIRASLVFVDSDRASASIVYEVASSGRGHKRFHTHDTEENESFTREAGDDEDEEAKDRWQSIRKSSRYRGRLRSRNDTPKRSSGLQIDLENTSEKSFPKSAKASQQDFITLMKLLKGVIQDGYTALLDPRCHCAIETFADLINGLDHKKMQELTEAENQFRRILRLYPNEGLNCLAYCGVGSVYLKKNRFSDALKHFQTARDIIGHLPGVIPWPTHSMVIEETQPVKIKVLLEKLIEECKYPPPPEGICAYHGHCMALKIQIYISDPDFKGYIRILCNEICKLEYHINCWKKLKALCYGDKLDKDFLNARCITPNCHGIIYKITVYNSKGGMKCEFEHKVIKEKFSPRPKVKQKCTSLEKLKERGEKKLNRKIQKEEAKKLAKRRLEESLRESNPPMKEEKKGEIQAYQFLDDRILQCLLQYSKEIKASMLNISELMKELLSWKVLTADDYTACFSSRNFLNDAVDFIIQLLIDKNNRVKTRIFLHVLSEHKEMDHQVVAWIEKLNGFGFTAVEHFFSRYGELLKNLDFTFLSFLWNEKYGSNLGSIEGKTFDYFCEPASSKGARYLLWLLEDHREKFPALHSALDEYFDVLDSSCTVLRKQDHTGIQYVPPTKVKNKGKKKKPKDLKPMLVGSGLPLIKSGVKSETGTSSENKKSNSGSSGPFAVPQHLRKNIEGFETYYRKKQQLQNQQDKKSEASSKSKSTLYDYFSEYLKDNGPLDIRDKVFSNEYRFFPEETRQIVQEAGGLKKFLLRCPRFVVIDNCIALRTVTTRFKKKGKKRVVKEEVDDLVNIEDELYLPFFMSLGQEAKEVTPEADPSSSSAKEDSMPTPASADSPDLACADQPMEPKVASQNVPRPVTENKYVRWIASDSLQSGSEGTAHMPFSSQSLVPLCGNVTSTYWAQPPSVLGYCTYLPFQGYDITQMPPTYIHELSSVPPYAGIYTPLPRIAEYELQQGVPFLQSFIVLSQPAPNAAVRYKRPPKNTESASGHQETPAKPLCSSAAAVPAHGGSSRNDGHNEKSTNREEDNRMETKAATACPPTQTATGKVTRVMVDQEVSTDSYQVYEAKPGDISRIEKEYRKLQEMLEHAYENYKQTRFKGLAEIRDLEEKLQANAKQSQASQKELEWCLQDMEKETRKWQQEKREAQEKIKALRKKVRKLEMCTQKNDEKDEEHEVHLDESLEIRNSFANEKAKLEAHIKKREQDYAEVRERFMDAQVSVLESWKELYVWKLEVTKSSGESYVESLRRRSSDYDESLLEAVLQEWDMCFSWIKDELELVDSQVEEKLEEARSGVDISEVIQMLCLPAFDPNEPNNDEKDAGASAEHGSKEQSEVARLLASAKKAVLEAQARQSPSGEQKPPLAPGRAARSHQKPFNSIIEHLAAVFPCYSSSRLAGFVKKVRAKSSLLGLSIDETVRRVIEHILDEQKKEASATNSCELCHQATKSKNACVLNCQHTFHTWCFEQWLKGQSFAQIARNKRGENSRT